MKGTAASVSAPLIPQQPGSSPIVAAQAVGFPSLALVAILAASALIPYLLRSSSATQLFAGNNYRWAWAAAFVLNCLCVSIPGRFDNKMADEGIKVVWRSLFAPSSWAFATWGVIYLAELVASLYVTVWSNDSARRATAFWLAGNLFQCLWCLAFRPAFLRALWLPALLLALGAGSLFGAHVELTRQMAATASRAAWLPLALLRLPIALHGSW